MARWGTNIFDFKVSLMERSCFATKPFPTHAPSICSALARQSCLRMEQTDLKSNELVWVELKRRLDALTPIPSNNNALFKAAARVRMGYFKNS